jgi:hypothetical protein
MMLTLARRFLFPRASSILASYQYYSKQSIDETNKQKKFANWRLDKRQPEFSYATHEKINDPAYIAAMHSMEISVYELALTYLKRSTQAGNLLLFVRELSSRCFDLYQAMVDIEHNRHYPMLAKEAGVLKAFTFNTEEILLLKSKAYIYLDTAQKISTIVKKKPNASELYKRLIVHLIFHKQQDLLKLGFVADEIAQLNKIFSWYAENTDSKLAHLIQEVHLMMGAIIQKFSFQEIYAQLFLLVHADCNKMHDKTEALLREIESRIIGADLSDERAIGFVKDAQVYFNILMGNTEDLDEKAEFRLRMYFVYKSIHLISRLIQNEPLVNEVNSWLKTRHRTWSIEEHYITLIKQRAGDPNSHEFYRNGPYSDYMTIIRKTNCCVDLPSYLKSEQMSVNKPQFFNALSKVEKKELSRRNKSPAFFTGAYIFEQGNPFKKLPEGNNINEKLVIEYVDAIKKSSMPVCSAGPSGATIQLATTAGFVGLCLDSNKDTVFFERQMLKLACLAFMLPGDHTVHEIMLQFYVLFGDAYKAGIGYQEYIYPEDNDYVSSTLEKIQAEKESYCPKLSL